MTNSHLLSIGRFAARSGLTASALRFYADGGLLEPAHVDSASGYRYYDPDQVPRAEMIRDLREIAMPLGEVEAVLDAPADDVPRLIDEHLARIAADAAHAQRKALGIKAALATGGGMPLGALRGPVFADAADQVLGTTVRHEDLPVLRGIHVAIDGAAVTLVGTDRYRLTSRTLAAAEPQEAAWSGVVDGDDLRQAAVAARRTATVRLDAAPHGLRLRTADGVDHYCRLLTEEFPDVWSMLDGLAEVTTRVTVAKDAVVEILQRHGDDRVTLDVAEPVLRIETGAESYEVAATVSGPPMRVLFGLPVLYPALSGAIGPDVMLDLRGEAGPVTVRSADRGDLTTVVMPRRPEAEGDDAGDGSSGPART